MCVGGFAAVELCFVRVFIVLESTVILVCRMDRQLHVVIMKAQASNTMRVPRQIRPQPEEV